MDDKLYILFKIIFIGLLIYLIFFRRKSLGNPTSSKEKTNSNRSGDVSEQNESSTHPENGETIWAGEPIELSFTYVDKEGHRTSRNIFLKRIFTKSTGYYFEGHCLLRKEDRTFKASRIGERIYSDGNKYTIQSLIKMLSNGRIADKNIVNTEKNDKYQYADTKSNRYHFSKGLYYIDWRKEGILSMSGYHVGKTKGVPENERHRILNSLLLYDDLDDVGDRSYAEEWGRPGTRKRYKKIHDSILTFLNNGIAKNRSGGFDMSKAIDDWKSDASYIENEIYYLCN